MKLSSGDLLKLEKRLDELKKQMHDVNRILTFINLCSVRNEDIEIFKEFVEILEYKISVLENPDSFKEIKENFKLKKVLSNDKLSNNKRV